MSDLLITTEDSIRFLKLNRPEKRNALNDTLIDALKEALRDADKDESLRAIVLRGEGEDFCSGADLSSLQKISESSITENREDAQSLMELFALIRKVKIPVIAAVRGRALAGGCGLATACDLAVASANARFGYPEVKIGFVPAMVIAILRRNISEKRAFELATRGFEYDAETALKFGLVNELFPNEDFDKSVLAYARHYEKLSRSAVILTKNLLYEMDGLNFESSLRTGADINAIARTTDDCKQGIVKFLKK